MKSEVIIRNWLMGWFRPEEETELNTPDKLRPKLDKSYYDSFMDQFVDSKKKPVFSEDEKEAVKKIIVQPLTFATGHPLNISEKPKVGHIYITEADYSETSHYIGSRILYGKTPTSIVVVGSTVGSLLNMAEPSILIRIISILLWAGRNYFTSQHLEEPTINETNLAQDETNSFDKGIAMRSLIMSYKTEISSPITNFGVLEDG
jgi:hypothetical protein